MNKFIYPLCRRFLSFVRMGGVAFCYCILLPPHVVFLSLGLRGGFGELKNELLSKPVKKTNSECLRGAVERKREREIVCVCERERERGG